MALTATATIDNTGVVLQGSAWFKDDLTIEQDAGRVANLATYTVLSKLSSDGKYTPLIDVSPALTPGSMACGALGGTAAEFAALASSSFKIGFDGEAVIEVVCDFTGLDTILDTPGYMTCGAIGGTLPEFAAVADGQFGIAFDGGAAIQITGMDFSGIDTVEDTPGYWLCGANGDVIGNWDALTDAAFSYVVDGVAYDTGAMNLTASVTFDGLINIINFHLNGHATMTYAYTVDKFQLVSNRTGETSSVTIGAPAAGTDISAAGYLNAAAGAATAGTGGEALGETMTSIINSALLGRGVCYFNGDAFVFISRTAGEVSAVSDLTAGTAGTDISGAGFLNGLAGTNVAGTGGEGTFQSIVDIINAELVGRGECSYDGDKFIFWSNTTDVASAVSVLTAGVTGTDISGAAYLNGLTGTGVITVAATGDGTDFPAGIYIGDTILTADLVAGDVTNRKIWIKGAPMVLDEDKVVLENSLDLDDVITVTGKTIRQHLEDMGFLTRDADVNGQIAPI